MRLGYITSSYPRASDSFVREEVAALRRLGHDVKTYGIRRPDEAEVELSQTQHERDASSYVLGQPLSQWLVALVALPTRPGRLAVAVRLTRRLGTPGLRGRLWPWLYLLEAVLLARLLRRDRVEHLHDHISEGSAAVAMLAATLSNVPWSMTVHGPGEFERAERLALDVKAGSAAFVATISDYARGQLLRWVEPDDWSKVHVVRCGIAPRFMEQPLDTPEPEARVVCIARLDPVKGQRLLVEALACLASSGTQLDLALVGDGPDRANVEAAVRERGVADRVRLLGWGSAQTVQDELIRARALVLPSLAEGLPVVIMEALALGRPVVATDVAAVGELVRSGETGWLVQPGDVAGLVAALREVATADDDVLRAMGHRGAVAVRARHDINVIAEQLSGLFSGKRPGLPP